MEVYCSVVTRRECFLGHLIHILGPLPKEGPCPVVVPCDVVAGRYLRVPYPLVHDDIFTSRRPALQRYPRPVWDDIGIEHHHHIVLVERVLHPLGDHAMLPEEEIMCIHLGAYWAVRADDMPFVPVAAGILLVLLEDWSVLSCKVCIRNGNHVHRWDFYAFISGSGFTPFCSCSCSSRFDSPTEMIIGSPPSVRVDGCIIAAAKGEQINEIFELQPNKEGDGGERDRTEVGRRLPRLRQF
mmetsp:Transcript_9787/g.23926  ORF Transcript_9787/g.23926 Transcript_9787/m.23926 type:complete len:240 (+) Transcript_9787:263-982(+)